MMRVEDLIQELQQYDPNAPVKIGDSKTELRRVWNSYDYGVVLLSW